MAYFATAFYSASVRPRPGTVLRRYLLQLLLIFCIPFQAAGANEEDRGKALYDYWCYQCHGYAGDGRTLSSVFLSPPPRNFTAFTPEQLNRGRMIEAVTNGTQGSGMVPFSTVISQQEIGQVVDFIRREFMQGIPSDRVYHSVENGWQNHGRYRAAFPFVLGEVGVDTAEFELSESERKGRALFMNHCISCHDRPLNSEMTPVQWVSSQEAGQIGLSRAAP